MPTLAVVPPRSARAIGSVRKPSSSAAACTRAWVSSDTWRPRSAYDTAAGERPVCSASCRIVGRRGRADALVAVTHGA